MSVDRMEEQIDRSGATVDAAPKLALLLQTAHEQSRLPVAAVAGAVGVSESYLSKLLNGHRLRPSRDLLLALAYVWGIRRLEEIDRILEAANHPRLSRPAP
jgi:transcriptional regulator with XRE-family HTH domain